MGKDQSSPGERKERNFASPSYARLVLTLEKMLKDHGAPRAEQKIDAYRDDKWNHADKRYCQLLGEQLAHYTRDGLDKGKRGIEKYKASAVPILLNQKGFRKLRKEVESWVRILDRDDNRQR